MSSYSRLFHHLRDVLQPLYDGGEAAAIARRYLAEVTGIDYASGLARRDENLPEGLSTRIEQDTQQLAAGKPVQYVLGYEEFLGRKFRVNEAVLIPRPETELVVNWVAEGCPNAKTVLDVGTGSGCIAVSLALTLPGAQLYAVDVSEDALIVAQQNADALSARVTFLQMDALDAKAWRTLPQQLDVIVSNPPYIPAAERKLLHENVRDWEPHAALFVPDSDPLIFYRTIAEAGKRHLQAGGHIYCELQSDRAEETKDLFESIGYRAELRKDEFGLWRMLRAMK